MEHQGHENYPKILFALDGGCPRPRGTMDGMNRRNVPMAVRFLAPEHPFASHMTQIREWAAPAYCAWLVVLQGPI